VEPAPVPTTGEVNIAKPTAKREPQAVTSVTGDATVAAPQLTLSQLEKLYVLDTLKKTNGNKTKAAELLGVSLKTIYNKLASYATIEERA
jgi:DNA-binding NtrC family response regulator